MVAAYKRANAADASRSVIDRYYFGPWLPADTARQPLPVALDLGGLYERLLRALLPYPPRHGEALAAQLQRIERLRVLEGEHDRLEVRLQRERQFNRKVALDAELRQIRNAMRDLG